MHQKKDETGHICLYLPIGFPLARQIVDDWWHMPVREEDLDLSRFRQQLFLEQTVMNELFPVKHSDLTSPAPPLVHFARVCMAIPAVRKGNYRRSEGQFPP